MSSARRIVTALAALLAVTMAVAAVALWPLVQRADAAYVAYVQRDVEFGWLLLQAATPLFAACVVLALGAVALAWRLAMSHPAAAGAPQRR